MSNQLLSLAGALLLSGALAACSGSQPAAAAPSDSAAPAASAAPEAAPSASATAAAPPAAPADPMLAGLSGDDLDWGKSCLDGKGSYCTKFGNVAEFNAKDYGKALAWYKKGCDAAKREPVCCMGVARLTIQGQGTTADVAGGLKLWADTCAMELGRDACSELAASYETGNNGVKKDAKKAKEIYGKACDLGNASACKKAGKKPPKP